MDNFEGENNNAIENYNTRQDDSCSLDLLFYSVPLNDDIDVVKTPI